MAYYGINEAIGARLTGADPQSVPDFHTLRAHRLDGPLAEATTPARFRAQENVLVGQVKVPVFDPDAKAKLTRLIYPSLTFDIISCTPRYEEAAYYSEVYQGDGYEEPLAGSEEDVYEDDTLLGHEARVVKHRAIEHPMDVLFTVTAYAAESFTRMLLIDYVYRVFPPRGYLRVPMKDGTYRSWDVLLQSAKNLEASKIPYETLGMEREYANVFTYKVEAYLDNTDRAQLMQRVRERLVECEQVAQ